MHFPQGIGKGEVCHSIQLLMATVPIVQMVIATRRGLFYVLEHTEAATMEAMNHGAI